MNLVGDVFEHSFSTLQQRPSEPSPDFGSCSLLPHISISIFGRELLAQLDSGSEVTWMNEEEFSAILSGRKIATLPVSSTFIRGTTGHQSHEIKTQTWLQFSIGSQTFEFFAGLSNFFKVNLKAGSLGYHKTIKHPQIQLRKKQLGNIPVRSTQVHRRGRGASDSTLSPTRGDVSRRKKIDSPSFRLAFTFATRSFAPKTLGDD
ncbi:hypothetical protein Zmor_015389 [Zophobas morio]|uniref:Uncharacterized protein n=1 Tax=Zophobas morio TaxID=2755281 RepID=A0AA38MHF8_9CUCU|nr:hypothetical protein Zmor_015389 [Zophobas morio]